MNIRKNAIDLIGNTPLLEISNYSLAQNLAARLLVKLEYLNPFGSVKDRVALAMIESAERSGELLPNSVIIEPTSGNTGIALAAVAACKGYKVIIVMPDTMSVERRNIIAAYGAQIVLSDGAKGMRGAIELAQQIQAQTKSSVIMGQFENPANPQAHYNTTGPEIWRDCDGNIDCFIAGVGTGGTISGVGKFLKEQNNKVKVVAVEPLGSPVLSQAKSGAHKIQGIGAGFIPQTLDATIFDEVVAVSDEQAFATAKLLGKTEGVLVGISSGAALYAATQIAKAQSYRGKTIVALLPDSADRYYSTPLFE